MRLIIFLGLIGICGCEAGDAERQSNRQDATPQVLDEMGDTLPAKEGRTAEDNMASLPDGTSEADVKKAEPADRARPESSAGTTGDKEGWDPKWKERIEDLLNDVENGEFDAGQLPEDRADAPKPVQDLIKELERIAAENPGDLEGWDGWNKDEWTSDQKEDAWDKEDWLRERGERKNDKERTARDMERWKSEAKAFLTR